MTDRPIIFSASMIRALIDGRKFQTRRLLKPQHGDLDNVFQDGGGFWHVTDSMGAWMSQVRVPFAPGDRLWCREAFSGPYGCDHLSPSQWLPNTYGTAQDRAREAVGYVWYWADGNPEYGDWTRPKPSIHMPRWASRLTLTVTDVRVQRVAEISEEDAVAEGCPTEMCVCGGYDAGLCICAAIPKRDHFADLWNSLHGPDAWSDNPWVAALSFTVRQGNIDA